MPSNIRYFGLWCYNCGQPFFTRSAKKSQCPHCRTQVRMNVKCVDRKENLFQSRLAARAWVKAQNKIFLKSEAKKFINL